jgi:putative acetyltransferase
MFRIRSARTDDLHRNVEIWQSAVRATHDFLSAEHYAEIAELVRDQYLPGANLLVAVDDQDVPHGFLGASGAHVDALFVHADSRGAGIGRLLMQHVMRNVDVATVDVNAQNAAARGFYERLGFVVYDATDVDDAGRPYPLLRLRWHRPPEAGGVLR